MTTERDYGAASPSTPSSSRTATATRKPTHEGHASVTSSIINLTNTAVGAGALAFPSAFASMGLIPGILSCAGSGLTAIFGLYCLSRCAAVVGTRPGDEGRKASFNELARLTFGKGWATKLFDLAIAIKCFGVSVSYLIICKTLLPQVCYTLSKVFHHPLPEDSILLASHFWLIVWMVVVIPLSFLRTLDALRFTSQIALLTVVYLVLVVVGWFAVKGVSPNHGEVVLARFGRNTLSNFPVQVFAYTCSQNLFPIYNELKNKHQRKMNTVIVASMGSAAATYEVIGIIGYLTFGSKVGSNVIAMYPPTSLIIAIGRLGIVLLVGLSYPLQVLPCRQSLHHLTHGLFRHPKIANITNNGTSDSPSARRPEEEENSDTDDESEINPLVPKADDHGHVHKHEMSKIEFIAITTAILVAGFLIAYNVHELEIVLGFVGSTGSTIITFILPGFFYFRLFRQERGVTKWWALALGIYGLVVMAFW
uniref:Vacuolar amino acid transporter 5 n=1 Tax=Kwoniella bestiolae CBS 10118 TaxID=1296100 RepID=A0A1B9G8K3_9TREE|nr:vacuolar amino acid transporter 5 [Kwoniella bestiolae CBS 10118]OCF27358.1 vacuolar amino acid transporter 5 [Kwoniella bestiolae CBS 10118]